MTGKEPFEVIVRQHGPSVLRVCRAVLARHDADDAWSETFLAALRAYPDLPGGANVQAWLVTIAHRKALDLTRANQRRPTAVAEPPEPVVHPPPEADDDLWDRLRGLPPKQRQVVAYHHLAGLAYDDIAAIVGGSSAAARRAGSDGIRALRRLYAPREGSHT